MVFPLARRIVLIALIALPAAVYVLEALSPRAASQAVVPVAVPVGDRASDSATTFGLASVLQAQSIPQYTLQFDTVPAESLPATELPAAEPLPTSRRSLVVSAPAFRPPRASALMNVLGQDALAEIIANTVEPSAAPPLLVDRSSTGVLADTSPPQSPLLEALPAGSDQDAAFELGGLDEPPQLIEGGVARYPSLLASQGVDGVVDVRFAVDSTGIPDSIQILSASDRRFEQPVREAIQRSRYRPGRIGGVPVRTFVEQRFTFRGESSGPAQQSALRAPTREASSPVDQSRVYDGTAVDEPPVLITGATPQYPQVLWDQGVDGFVDVEFVIGLSGQAERSSIDVTFASHWRFEQPARDAIMLSLYRPGLIGSTPVRVQTRLRVRFTRP